MRRFTLWLVVAGCFLLAWVAAYHAGCSNMTL